MNAMEATERLRLLVEHHRECCSEMHDGVRMRNRLFILALVVLAGITLRAWHAASGERILALVFDRVIGAHTDIDRAVLSALLWASLLFVTARYFQTHVQLDRQYAHLARVESEITALFGSDLLARESAGYLKNYPLFSEWMHILYTWVFPIALLAVTLWSVGIEFHIGDLSAATLVPCAIGAVAAISTALYICSSKVEPWRRRRRERRSCQKEGASGRSRPAATPSAGAKR
jgi:hypothetical protein